MPVRRSAVRCGTNAGYNRHRRHEEPACPSCLAAHREAVARSVAREMWGVGGPCRRTGCTAPAVELGLCAGHLLAYRALVPVLTGGRPPGHKARRI